LQDGADRERRGGGRGPDNCEGVAGNDSAGDLTSPRLAARVVVDDQFDLWRFAGRVGLFDGEAGAIGDRSAERRSGAGYGGGYGDLRRRRLCAGTRRGYKRQAHSEGCQPDGHNAGAAIRLNAIEMTEHPSSPGQAFVQCPPAR
jgi:hypothetical protein